MVTLRWSLIDGLFQQPYATASSSLSPKRCSLTSLRSTAGDPVNSSGHLTRTDSWCHHPRNCPGDEGDCKLEDTPVCWDHQPLFSNHGATWERTRDLFTAARSDKLTKVAAANTTLSVGYSSMILVNIQRPAPNCRLPQQQSMMLFENLAQDGLIRQTCGTLHKQGCKGEGHTRN